LARAFEGVDVVVHAAALKIVPTAEYNPFETVKTNIIGAMNVIDAALDSGVSRVVALSTDKASSPVNLYGATKLVSDKLFIAANSYGANSRTVFSVVRYGNVMASRGSIIPLFNEQASRGLITITDSRMTRFFLSLDEGIDLVLHALGDAVGGEIYVKKIPSANVIDVAEAVAPGSEISIVGVRPGEKLHEQLIGSEESHMCLEFEGHFVIYPNASSQDKGRLKGGQSVAESFSYSSETNQHWLDVSQLRKKIEALTDAS
jgi:FlaA1/EpsC-like NDP-sugar epimerase